MKLPTSIRARLILSHLLVSVASIILIAVFAGSAIYRAALKDIENDLEDLAFAASSILNTPLQQYQAGERDADSMERAVSHLFVNRPELHYTIYQADGSPLLSNEEDLMIEPAAATAPEVVDALASAIIEGGEIRVDPQGKERIYVAARLEGEEEIYGVLHLGVELSAALAPARRSLGFLILVSALVTLAVGLFGWLFANNLSRPIQNLTHAATNLSQGNLSARVAPTGPHELHSLAEAFNSMARRLQGRVDELRSFVANASHELRTPLTVVKLRVEALRNGALEDQKVAEQFLEEIESEVDRLGKMVNDLLDLSRLEAGLALSNHSLVNLGVVASDVCETFSIRANRAGVNLSLKVEPDLPMVLGVEDQLRRVLYNFVENAIKYTPHGGQVDLIASKGEHRSVRMAVKDTGPGIHPSDLSHIFERFYRIDATRPRYGPAKGSGLGLAIAKSIIENHGGRIGVSSQVGKGSTFWAELPVRG